MSRYNRTRIRSSFGEKPKSYKTTIYKKVEETDDDIYVITQAGDRLDTIAHQFYGDSHLWWFIAKVNNLNSMNVPVGIRLRISNDLDKARIEFDNSNER